MTHEIDAAETIAALEETLRKANREVKYLSSRLNDRKLELNTVKIELKQAKATIEGYRSKVPYLAHTEEGDLLRIYSELDDALDRVRRGQAQAVEAARDLLKLISPHKEIDDGQTYS